MFRSLSPEGGGTKANALDELFQADESAHLEAGQVKQRQGQEPGHAAIAIPEGMNAEEIQDVRGDEQRLLDVAFLPKDLEPLVESFHRLGGRVRQGGGEANRFRAVRVQLRDFVIHALPLAASIGRELEKIAMKLQDHTGGERDVRSGTMNGVQNVAVAGDFLFRTVPRRPSKRAGVPIAGRRLAGRRRRCAACTRAR